MPELPEVETTVRGLKNRVVGRTIEDIWTDWPKYFKKPSKKKDFYDCVIGEEIKDVQRKGKNILIELSGDKILLVHQKMSGHFLVGRWRMRSEVSEVPGEKWENEKWVPENQYGKMADEKNRFIRLIFFLDNDEMLALSDLRRFAKVLCGSKEEVLNSDDLDLGPDPLSSDFNFEDFKEIIGSRKARIKTLLMDQKTITGIGNIYSDEALWKAKIHPFTPANEIPESKLKVLYESIIEILKKAVKLKGTSIDDYRDPKGKKGKFGEELLVYQKDGDPCPRCGEKIDRIKMGSRSARFCPSCQKK